MDTLRIRLLGELRLELDGRRLHAIASGRARSLLGWLGYHPGLHPRTTTAGLGVATAWLGAERAAGELYPRLLPFGHRIVTVDRGRVCAGSA